MEHQMEFTDTDRVRAYLQAVRGHLDRIEEILIPPALAQRKEDDLDPKNPLNKSGVNLTKRGVEVCYRMFDAGRTRYAVSAALDISYGAATHRYHAWEKLGGAERERSSLDG